MFLFSKRAKKVVKYAWGAFSLLIVLSMVITYSGFTMLAGTQPAAQDVPPEVLAELEAQRAARGSSTVPANVLEELQRQAGTGTEPGTIKLAPAVVPPEAAAPVTPPPPPLNFSL